MNTTENELESTENESANLLALASIISGLLASGVYTLDDYGMPGLVSKDMGENWKDYRSCMPAICGRYYPTVLDHAEELFVAAKRIAKDYQ